MNITITKDKDNSRHYKWTVTCEIGTATYSYDLHRKCEAEELKTLLIEAHAKDENFEPDDVFIPFDNALEASDELGIDA